MLGHLKRLTKMKEVARKLAASVCYNFTIQREREKGLSANAIGTDFVWYMCYRSIFLQDQNIDVSAT